MLYVSVIVNKKQHRFNCSLVAFIPIFLIVSQPIVHIGNIPRRFNKIVKIIQSPQLIESDLLLAYDLSTYPESLYMTMGMPIKRLWIVKDLKLLAQDDCAGLGKYKLGRVVERREMTNHYLPSQTAWQ